MDELEQLKKENAKLKKDLDAYRIDASNRGVFALNRILNLQIDQLANFDINKTIGQDPKEDKIYDRTRALWEQMPKMITELNNLRESMGISKNAEEVEMLLPISPESIAESV